MLTHRTGTRWMEYMCSEAQTANEITTTRTTERVDWLSQFQETGQTDRDDDDDPFVPSTLNRIDNREGQNKKQKKK